MKTLYPVGVAPHVAAHFELIQAAEDDVGIYWDFPVYDCDHTRAGTRRFFRYPDRQKPPWGFLWTLGPEPPSTSYNLVAVLEVLADDMPVWVTATEHEVWLLHAEGIPAFCAYSKEGISAAIEVLADRGARTVHVLPPQSDRGRTLASEWSRATKAQRLKCEVHDFLPGTVGLLDFLTQCHEGEFDVPRALLDLPSVDRGTLDAWSRTANKPAPEEGVMPKPKSRRQSAATINEHAENLLAILNEPALEIRLFTDTEDEFFSILWKGKRENYALGSARSKYLLDEICDERMNILPSDAVFTLAEHRLKRQASRDGEEREVTPLIQEYQGRLYFDLANRAGEVVEVGDDIEGGWRIILDPPVIFRRASGTQPLPMPIRNSDNKEVWKKFRELFKPGSDANWVLMVGWLFQCMRAPHAPFMGLSVSGKQDAGKTERSKMLRQLIDPNKLSLAELPENPRELAIQAQNRFILGYDNLSGLQKWQSDSFCRIVTDGNFATRRLHTNDEEKIFSAKRPLLLNGIDNLLGRDDLQRRMVFVDIPRFNDTSKKISVKELWDGFDALRPAILGALFDAVAVGLANLPSTPTPEVGGGMVDSARWVAAAEDALPWEPGEFVETYVASMEKTKIVSLDEPFAKAVLAVMLDEHKNGHDSLAGPVGDIYKAVCYRAALASLESDKDYDTYTPQEQHRQRERAVENLKKEKMIPANEIWFGRQLRRREDALRTLGIECSYTQGQLNPWVLKWLPGFPKPEKAPEPKPPLEPKLPMYDGPDPFEDEE